MPSSGKNEKEEITIHTLLTKKEKKRLDDNCVVVDYQMNLPFAQLEEKIKLHRQIK